MRKNKRKRKLTLDEIHSEHELNSVMLDLTDSAVCSELIGKLLQSYCKFLDAENASSDDIQRILAEICFVLSDSFFKSSKMGIIDPDRLKNVINAIKGENNEKDLGKSKKSDNMYI